MALPAATVGLPLRMVRLLTGLVIAGSGLAWMVLAGLGLGPWDVLHQGVAQHTGVAIGTVSIAVGAVLLLLWIPLRARPGIGTVCNVVLLGLVVNAWLAVVTPAGSLPVRTMLLVAGLPAFAAGVGLYLSAALGPGPRDGLMTGLADRGVPVWAARLLIEAAALAVGWLLGGTVGPGTVLFVVAIGPLVHLAVHHFRLDPSPGEPVGDLTARR